MTLSFPEFDFGWIAWVALVPLLWAIRGMSPPQAFLAGGLAGVGAAYGIFGWLFNVPGFGVLHSVLLAFYFAAYIALWACGIAILGSSRIPLILTAPAMWVTLDYLKAHAGFLSVPWASLAHSQHDNLPLLQIASVTGEYGVTFLVVMGNIVLFLMISRRAWRQTIPAVILLACVHLWGFFELSRVKPGQTMTVAAVQPSILYGERNSVAGRSAVMERLRRLTREAAAAQPALVIWPETAVHNITTDQALQKDLQKIARQAGAAILTGSSDFAKLFRGPGRETTPAGSYNAAFLISPGQGIGEPYRKHILLPFAEYLPLESTVSWPSWLAPRVFHVVAGNTNQPLRLEDGRKFSVIICWENMFPDYVRESVLKGSGFIAHLSNDVWFGRSAAASQHNLASVLRAVEHRIPIVVASNAGPSQIIDPFGRILARGPELFRVGVIAAAIPAGAAGTFYTAHGDLAVLCIILFIAFIFAFQMVKCLYHLRLPAKGPAWSVLSRAGGRHHANPLAREGEETQKEARHEQFLHDGEG